MRSGHPIRSLAAALLAAFLVTGGTGACARNSGISERGLLFSADLSPRVSGEIYRVTLQGRRTNLSRSFYADTEPLISPDGKRVAFLSGRAGYPAVYVVGIDGRGLKRVSPELPKTGSYDWGSLSWSPAGTQLAAIFGKTGTNSLYLLALDRKPRRIALEGEIDGTAWSPDGRLIAYEWPVSPTSSQVAAVTTTGRHVFTVPGSYLLGPQWSLTGQLVIQGKARVRLYDRRGQLLAAVAGQTFAFSPDCKRLATVLGRELEVRDGGGLGRVILRKTVISPGVPKALDGDYDPQLSWLGRDRVAVSPEGIYGGSGNYSSQPAVGVDVPSGRIRPVAYRLWLSWQPCSLTTPDCTSPNRSLIAETVRIRDKFALRVARIDGSDARTVALVPGCLSDGDFLPAISGLQFSRDGRALVYQSDCAESYANLYSISPDGSNLRRLTHASRQQDQPQWSPDGRRIAFSQRRWTGLTCQGCAFTIWVVDANGKHLRQLTSEPYMNWDGPPIWSPDGREILYLHSTQDSSTFFVIPAAGGRPQELERGLHIRGDEQTLGPHRIAYIRYEGALWTVGFDGKDRQRVTPKPSDNGRPFVGSLAWSRDGRLAWISSSHNTISLEILTPGGQRSSFSLRGLDAGNLAWSPDGHSLAFTASPPEGPSDVYTISDKGTNVRRLTHGIGASSVSWR